MLDSSKSQPTPTRADATHATPQIWQTVIFLALAALFLSLTVQSCSFVRSRQYLVALPALTVQDGAHTFELDITYPGGVGFEATTAPERSITARMTLTGGIVITTPISYTIGFTPNDNRLLFTDAQGNPSAAAVTIAANHLPGQPGVVYVARAPTAAEKPEPVTVHVSVSNPAQTPVLVEPAADAVMRINIENSVVAGVLRFFDLLFGPTTALISSAVALLGFVVQYELKRRDAIETREWEAQNEQRQWDRNQQQEQIKREGQRQAEELNRRRTEMQEAIRQYSDSDPGKSVRVWDNYRQKIETQSEWNHSVLRDALHDLLKNEIPDNWPEKVLQEAVGNLSNNNLKEAQQRAALIRQLAPENETVAAVAAQILEAYLAEKPRQITLVASKAGIGTTLDAIKKLQTTPSPTMRKVAVKAIATLLITIDANKPEIDTLATYLDSAEGQRLVKAPELGETLQQVAANTETKNMQALAQTLLEQRQDNYKFNPWDNVVRPITGMAEEKWLQEIYQPQAHHPFGPEYAELEPNLPNYVPPPVFLWPHNPVQDKQPVVLHGPAGSGKTAAALRLMYDCSHPNAPPRHPGTFPVYCPVTCLETARTLNLHHLTHSISEALLEVLVAQPYLFLDHKPNHKYAMAHLLALGNGSVQQLITRLTQTQLSNESAGLLLLEEITRFGQKINPTSPPAAVTLVEMLQYTLPVGFDCYYLLVDVRSRAITGSVSHQLKQSIQQLLELMPALARHNTYLKLFVPTRLVDAVTVPPAITPVALTWSPQELHDMLDIRLAYSRLNTLAKLIDTKQFQPALNLEDELLRAANGSPRKLVQLGNQLIAEQVRNNPAAHHIAQETIKLVLPHLNLIGQPDE